MQRACRSQEHHPLDPVSCVQQNPARVGDKSADPVFSGGVPKLPAAVIARRARQRGASSA